MEMVVERREERCPGLGFSLDIGERPACRAPRFREASGRMDSSVGRSVERRPKPVRPPTSSARPPAAALSDGCLTRPPKRPPDSDLDSDSAKGYQGALELRSTGGPG
jgi:hypothetical protein